MESSHVKIRGNVEEFYQKATGSINQHTSVEIESTGDWTLDHLNQLGKVFPLLRKLSIDSSDSCRRDFVVNIQSIIEAIWDIRLEALELKFISKAGSHSVNWADYCAHEPVFQASIQKLVVTDIRLPKGFPEYLFSGTGCPLLTVLTVDNCLESNVLESLSQISVTLKELKCQVKTNCNYNFRFPQLRLLKLRVKKAYGISKLEMDGLLPNLQTFEIVAPKQIQTNLSILTECKQLKSVTILGDQAFRDIEPILPLWAASSIFPELQVQAERFRSSSGAETSVKNFDWEVLIKIISLGFQISTDSVIGLMNDKEKFEQVQNYLQNNVSKLDLDLHRNLHNYLLRDLPIISCFTKLQAVTIFDAQDVTSQGFTQLLECALSLEDVYLINAEVNFQELRGRNNSLKSLRLLHFHGLLKFELILPALETLSLDNCDGESLLGQGHPDSSETYGKPRSCRCYGNFQELILKELLDGSESLQLASLKKLFLNHNPNSYGGSPPVYEELRVDIRCDRGHPNLEDLSVYNCTHIRQLRLQNLPSMVEFHISSQAESEDDLWLEEIQLDLPENCKITVENVVTTRPRLAYVLTSK